MAEEPHVRIGTMLYRLAEGFFDQTGLRPMRQRWGSLFAERQNVSGTPGVQNVNADDLRWMVDSFAGGEGQRVIDPTSDLSLRSFDRAQFLDFSQPGQMRLAYRFVATTGPSAGYVMELGRNNETWLVQSTGEVYYWNPSTAAWVSVATVGGGASPIAMAHSGSHEFVAMSNKRVHRMQEPATGEAYTIVMDDTIVGVTAGGSRLQILTESADAGVRLYDAGLHRTPPVTPKLRYTARDAGNETVDTSLQQRMAATKGGAVFFANQGPDCWVHEWDGAIGLPLEKLPPGFVGRAIAHANGVTYVGGGFPTVSSSGAVSERPAIFLIDHSTTGAVQLDIVLHRDEDPTTQIQMMQMFGADLYVLCSVADGTTRLWRVSLRDPIAAFLQNVISLSGARALSMTRDDSFVLCSGQTPRRRTAEYDIAATAEFTSSRYAFGLTEIKRLDAIEIVGVIPAGSSVQVSYEADDSGTVVGPLTFTSPGEQAISIIGSSFFFRTMHFKVRLISNSVSVTPIIYAIGLRAYLPKWDKHHELLLACFDESSVWRIDGQQLRGFDGKEYLYALAETGALVEYENRYESERPDEWRTATVMVQSPDAFYLGRGEALVRVTLVERGA